MSSAIESTLIDYERSLANGQCPTNIHDVSQVIANDFIEFGSSGKTHSKQDVLNWLNSKPTIDYVLDKFMLRPLSKNCYLLTYHAYRKFPNPAKSLRSSIWKQNKQQIWQLFFHQGTPI